MSRPSTPARPLSAVSTSGDAQDLIAHFVASKRSLASAQHIWRANEIVSSSRKSVEDYAAHRAKSHFLALRIRSADDLLRAIVEEVRLVSDQVKDEYDNVLDAVDTAAARVKTTLDQLSSTAVEPSLRPALQSDAVPADAEGEADHEAAVEEDASHHATLHDFIDSSGTAGLHAAVREVIDLIAEAQTDYTAGTSALEQHAAEIAAAVQAADQRAATQHDSPEGALVADVFRQLELHATEMAGELQSLVRHYDLCSTALRHTEGGAAAASLAAASSDQPALPAGLMDAALGEQHTNEAPMSKEELSEMVEVVRNDAGEVEDVVAEIEARAEEIERLFARLGALVQKMEEILQGDLKVVESVQAVDKVMPAVWEAARAYLARWAELRERMVEKVEEFDGLHAFYGGFVRAYDGLLVEIGRRRALRAQVEEVARRAAEKLQRLRDEDIEGRDAFNQDHGDFLPSNIWHGLTAAPPTFTFSTSEQGEDPIPEIDEDVIEAARKRLIRR